MKLEKSKILLTEEVDEILVNGLMQLGFEIDYYPFYTHNDFIGIINDYVGAITRSRIRFDKELLDKASKLKFIGRLGAGMENIDVDLAESKAIKCLNSPEGSRDAVGEHALGMLLALVNNMPRADQEVRRGLWQREANRGIEIKGRTVGIIGYGNMGSAFAEKLAGFSVNVIAYDKYKFDYTDEFVTEVDMPQIFRETDILSLHVPLTEETKYLVDHSYIDKFAKPLIIINTARGPVLDTTALVEHIKRAKVIGAALDVIEYEKFSFEDLEQDQIPGPMQYLVNSDKVIITPHVAGWTVESQLKLAEVLLDKIKKEFDF